MRILLTGASGFVGRALAARLLADPALTLRAAYRHVPAMTPAGMSVCAVGELGADTDWRAAVEAVDVVLHCAARAHVMRETEADPAAAFRQANTDGTLALARAAARAGCRRFVFLSSVKVNGEASAAGRPLRADDAPAPCDAYGRSKLEAEIGLRALAAETGLEVVILRPPLVYGPGVKGNFLAMMRAVHRGVPLPLGATRNRRSLIALDNLVDLIVSCATHPAAAGQVFLASDGEDLSTDELLRRTGRALGHPARLVPVPLALLRAGAALCGRRELFRRLCGSLQVDIEHTQRVLGWHPPMAVDEALAAAARHFLAHERQ